MKKKAFYLFIAFAGLVTATFTANAQHFHKTKYNRAPNTREDSFKKATEHLPDSSLHYRWDVNTLKYDSVYYSIFTYDNEGHIILEMTKDKNGVPLNKESRIYTNGEEALLVIEKYNTTTGLYDTTDRIETSYDDKGNWISTKYYMADPITQLYELISSDSGTYIYDGSGRITEIVALFYDTVLEAWVNFNRVELFYNGTETAPYRMISYEWEEANTLWNETSKEDIQEWGLGFSAIYASKPTVSYSYNWDGTDWVPFKYDSIVYSNNRPDTQFNHTWDGTAIQNWMKTSSAYDGHGKVFTRITEIYNQDIWKILAGYKDSAVYGSAGQVLETYSFFRNTLTYWNNQSKNQNYFDPQLSVKPSSASIINIYPNPSSDRVIIEKNTQEIMNIRVFSLQGKEIYRSAFSENKQEIDVRSWEKGIYILRLEGTSEVRSQKISIR